jgi:hypothetical protein
LKDKALDCSIWKDRFGRGFGPVVRQTTKWMMWPQLLAGQSFWEVHPSVSVSVCDLGNSTNSHPRLQLVCSTKKESNIKFT